MDSGRIVVKMMELEGEEWEFAIETYISLRDFVTSTDFLTVTKRNPNDLHFMVNGKGAPDDLLLIPGDEITVHWGASEKSLISPADARKRIKALKGLEFVRHGGNHDVWKTSAGNKIQFPRHKRDLTPGTLNNMLKQAGIDMNLDQFVSMKP